MKLDMDSVETNQASSPLPGKLVNLIQQFYDVDSPCPFFVIWYLGEFVQTGSHVKLSRKYLGIHPVNHTISPGEP